MFLKYNRWVLLWALFIFILCAIPGKSLPPAPFELLNFDKFVHAFLFCIQALLTVKGFSAQSSFLLLNKRPRLVTFLFCICYGALLELMQGAFFQQRSPELDDFIANSFGATLGIITFKPKQRN